MGRGRKAPLSPKSRRDLVSGSLFIFSRNSQLSLTYKSKQIMPEQIAFATEPTFIDDNRTRGRYVSAYVDDTDMIVIENGDERGMRESKRYPKELQWLLAAKLWWKDWLTEDMDIELDSWDLTEKLLRKEDGIKGQQFPFTLYLLTWWESRCDNPNQYKYFSNNQDAVDYVGAKVTGERFSIKETRFENMGDVLKALNDQAPLEESNHDNFKQSYRPKKILENPGICAYL